MDGGARVLCVRLDDAGEALVPAGRAERAGVEAEARWHSVPRNSDADMADPFGLRGRFRALVARLPQRVRDPFRRFLLLQLRALSALREAVGEQVARIQRAHPGRRGGCHRPRDDGVGACVVAIALVAPDGWHAAAAATLRRVRAAQGVRILLLFPDLMVLRQPQWHDRETRRGAAAWYREVLPLCDAVLLPSAAEAAQLARVAAGLGVALPAVVRAIPMGSALHPPAQPARPHGIVGEFVLCVGTLEPRNNHALLLAVWRQLIERREAHAVPMLVCVGRLGDGVADLMGQLRNAAFFDGRIRLLPQADAARMAALYRGCLFTICPALDADWALPVSESLTHGKPCLAADRPASREAGGGLACYFDPEDVGATVAAISVWLDDRAALAAWQARVAALFQPVGWAETAAAILAVALGHQGGGGADGGT